MTGTQGGDGRFQRVPFEERFWTKVDKSGGPRACWPWLGPKRKEGYGYTTDYWRKILAHRASYELSHGPIPEGLNVCHSCDNRICVNPAHLWVGTDSDNMQDAVRKGRHGQVPPDRRARGEVLAKKLTEEAVLAIRAEYEPLPPGFPVGARWHAHGKMTLSALAKKYGVSRSLIHAIVTRKTWTHI